MGFLYAIWLGQSVEQVAPVLSGDLSPTDSPGEFVHVGCVRLNASSLEPSRELGLYNGRRLAGHVLVGSSDDVLDMRVRLALHLLDGLPIQLELTAALGYQRGVRPLLVAMLEATQRFRSALLNLAVFGLIALIGVTTVLLSAATTGP